MFTATLDKWRRNSSSVVTSVRVTQLGAVPQSIVLFVKVEVRLDRRAGTWSICLNGTVIVEDGPINPPPRRFKTLRAAKLGVVTALQELGLVLSPGALG